MPLFSVRYGFKPALWGILFWLSSMACPALAQDSLYSQYAPDIQARFRSADSLKKLAEELESDSLRLASMNARALAFWYANDNESSLAINYELLKAYQEAGDLRNEIESLVNMYGNSRSLTQDSSKALMERAYALWKNSNRNLDLISPRSRFRLSHFFSNENRFFEAYNIIKDADVAYDSASLTENYYYYYIPHRKAYTQVVMGDTVRAVQHLKEYIKRCRKHQNPLAYLGDNNFMGITRDQIPNIDSINYYYNYYFRLLDEYQHKITDAGIYGVIGYNYYLAGEDSMAIYYSKKRIELDTAASPRFPFNTAQINLVMVYLNQNDTKSALPYIQYLDSLYQHSKYEPGEEIAELLYPYFLSKGDTAKAFYYYQYYAQGNRKSQMVIAQAKFARQQLEEQIKQERLLATLEQERQKRNNQAILISAVGALVLLTLGSWATLRYRRMRAQEKFNTALLQSELKALRAQINPHFIFNALASIQRYILNHNTQEANQYLTKFSRHIRQVLHHSDKLVLPLEEELEGLKQYLEIECLRLAPRLTYAFQVPEEINAKQYQLPSMLLQTFAENAIWHGISPKKEPGKIELRVQKTEGGLVIILEDNGIGREAAKAQDSRVNHKSKGLQMVQDKLELFNLSRPEQVSFQINDLYHPNGEARGTQVVLSLSQVAK